MTLKDRLKPAPSATSQPSFTCPHYDPPPGEKRCRSFVANGSCSRPDELMCTEWLRANGQAPAPRSERPPLKLVRDTTPRDLFGNPLPDPPRLPPNPARTAPPTTRPEAELPAGPVADPSVVRNLSDEEIRSFRDLGVEVCVASEALGEIWIVPAYTGAARREISVEHAATLTAICAAFPGAKVVRYEKAEPQPPIEPQI